MSRERTKSANPDVGKVERASALFSRSSGQMNLMVEGRRMTKSGLREVANWVRQGLKLLEEVAGKP